ncbi:hypothetical protein SAMN04488518_1264 [Pseudovibrio ascidiaceicola]|uniref:Uncharacterized protein n=1 Tax=Pseudovibrio ascidiaceicola TaxID=285279 RepID=A0A1I4G0Z3_9HYPH|nr:hypothetical protein [Pseudovibrio ascidiaceicola]SFL23822.1 hypothetical protein SAMN04488518_1264 [Pseudovibrio ascidiaceicola]
MKHVMSLFALAMLFSSPVQHATAQDKVKIRSCSPELKSKIIDAFQEFKFIARRKKNELITCMDKAYLVEHGRQSPSKIVGYLDRAKITKIKCRNLSGSTNASAHRVYAKRGVFEMDRDFIRDNSPRRIASVMAHETMHNNGLNHRANDFGSIYYKNTVPEQIEACYLTGKPNPWPGPGKDKYVAKDMVGFALDGENNYNFAWSKDGTVTAGSSARIHNYRHPYKYNLAPGYQPSDVVGMALDGENNMVFAWYRDGYVSAGSSNDLDSKRSKYRYSLPSGYEPSDIVGMAMDGENNWSFVWYKNGYVSAGSSDDLDKHRKPYKYTLAPGYTPADVAGMGVDGENNLNFVWYKDGFVSAGTSDDLDKHRPPKRVITGR